MVGSRPSLSAPLLAALLFSALAHSGHAFAAPSSARAASRDASKERVSASPASIGDIDWTTTCHQQGWWTLVLIESQYVLPLLPAGFDLAQNVSALNWPEGYHPVMLETQVQANCTESSVPLLKTTFHEFKLEIPYIRRRSAQGPEELFMFKPLLYANTWTDVFGARTVYGLHIEHAYNMPVNDTFFAVQYDIGVFNVTFDAGTGGWVPAEKAMIDDHLEVFRNITSLPWLCKGAAKCAYNRYDWDRSAMARPVEAVVSFGKGVLPDLGADVVKVDGTSVTPYGCVQLDAMLDISAVTDCPY